jgi:virulence-associated protein VapD
MNKMITLNITELLLGLVTILLLVLAYKYSQLLVKNEETEKRHIASLEETRKNLEKEYKDSIAAIEKEYLSDTKDFEQELLDIEDLAKKKIEQTEKAYQSAIDDINKDVLLYEKYIVNISTAIRLSDEKLKEIDANGIFKADDEIGWFFDSVKNIQKILNEFVVEVTEKNK